MTLPFPPHMATVLLCKFCVVVVVDVVVVMLIYA